MYTKEVCHINDDPKILFILNKILRSRFKTFIAIETCDGHPYSIQVKSVVIVKLRKTSRHAAAPTCQTWGNK